MPNPKGKPENLQPLSTDREEPLTKTLTIRVSESMYTEGRRGGEVLALDKTGVGFIGNYK
ncbi:MAG: hypothetical protein C6Y22_17180 [Hapalosiphonaceae cyanobacterium JJU2]|nr:MAG: hypothetical protein C6Y22_17180 [Hapalosiphonaceae cyanobacterium JJU2]